MPLEKICNRLTELVGDNYWITKPVYNCLPCMASIHGCFFYSYLFGFTWAVLPYCIALCGLNTLFSKIYYYEI